MVESVELKPFQKQCVSQLLEKTLEGKNSEIQVKSPTGSGKTMILIQYVEEYLREKENVIFVWLTPGQGELAEQSRLKMMQYAPQIHTKDVYDILTDGFSQGDVAFINWEKISQNRNRALREEENENLLERIRDAKQEHLSFILLIDEEHRNKTDKTSAIIDVFGADYKIRVSATPTKNPNSDFIEIAENDVIQAGLITKALYINEGIEGNIEIENEVEFLLELALKKREQIEIRSIKKEAKYRPLIIVQFPNEAEDLIKQVEQYLEKKQINYEKGNLAKWLAEDKKNIEGIEKRAASPIVLLMKQAIAVGWDCPRAKILVKLRQKKNEDFEIQLIGRIRRMPEAKHYEDDLLDYCYLYTFDKEYTRSVKQELGTKAPNIAYTILKPEEDIVQFQLPKEWKTQEQEEIAPRETYNLVLSYFVKKYDLTTDIQRNQTQFEKNNYCLKSKIQYKIGVGNIVEIEQENIQKHIDTVTIEGKVDPQKNRLEIRRAIQWISKQSGINAEVVKAILERMFKQDKHSNTRDKVLRLEKQQFCAFLINNQELLQRDFREGVSQYTNQNQIKSKPKTTYFQFPKIGLIPYDSVLGKGGQAKYNVYEGYPRKAIRSNPEKQFEEFCETSGKIKWWYKNGEAADSFLSIVYQNFLGKQYLFYPDYIIKDQQERIWVLEIKGGEDKQGNSKNIDIAIQNKYEALYHYAQENKIGWGFVRYYEKEKCLCISNQANYIEDMTDRTIWKKIEEVLT